MAYQQSCILARIWKNFQVFDRGVFDLWVLNPAILILGSDHLSIDCTQSSSPLCEDISYVGKGTLALHLMKPPRVVFTLFFMFTGLFAVVGGLFTWGKGWILTHEVEADVLIPLADVVLAGPTSLVTTWALYRKKDWGILLGLMVAGMYLFGSVQVYIRVGFHDGPCPWEWVVPPVAGIGFSLAYVAWVKQIGVIKRIKSE